MLGTTVPAGHTIRLQKDAANSSQLRDRLRQPGAGAPRSPTRTRPRTPCRPASPSRTCRTRWTRPGMDTTGTWTGVYLPAGDYQTAQKFQSTARAIKVVGAGPWYTRFHAPPTQENTDAGFACRATRAARRSAGFAYFGNYTSASTARARSFDLTNVANITIDNVWIEHTVCMYWGANTRRTSTITNSRIRDTFADGINMTNGSTDNLVTNDEARATGDDSFALFSAIDAGGADEKNNVFENLTRTLTWRAAGIAVYGGYNNTFRNIYIADTLCYSGITISSLDFGYPMNGFGAARRPRSRTSRIVRAGGHFWGAPDLPRDLGVLGVEGVPGHPGQRRGHRRPDLQRHHVPDELQRSAPQSRSPTPVHQHLDHRRPRRAATRSTPSPASGSGPTRCPRRARARPSAPPPSTTPPSVTTTSMCTTRRRRRSTLRWAEPSGTRTNGAAGRTFPAAPRTATDVEVNHG